MLRYERKYRIESIPAAWIVQMIRMHPGSFTQAYAPRQINNIYFDTPDLDGFEQNAAGIPDRKKHRLRWYGSQYEELLKPTFEIKIKDRELGYKKSHHLNSTRWEKLKETFSELPHLSYFNLCPVLVNSYQRSYFLSKDGKFRMTVDNELTYAPFQFPSPPKRQFPSPQPAVILELKYEKKYDEEAQRIFEHIPFRQTKNSKYMEGINLIFG